jgi:putative effector of murein hydrolase
VKLCLREVLVNSRVGAVAIAVLLLWALTSAFLALWGPVSRVGTFLYTAVAILGIPYFNPRLDRADRNMLMITFFYLIGAVVNLIAAWLLSRWAYGVGPLQSLRACGATVIGRNHV